MFETRNLFLVLLIETLSWPNGLKVLLTPISSRAVRMEEALPHARDVIPAVHPLESNGRTLFQPSALQMKRQRGGGGIETL